MGVFDSHYKGESHDQICFHFCMPNKVTFRDPFLTTFIEEVLEDVDICEVYLCHDGYYGYNQVLLM
jgi:hypothetical protein